MGNKFLLWTFVIIVFVVAINELFSLGKTTLAWVIIGIAVAVGLQAVYFLSRKANVKINSLYLVLFTLGILMVVTGTRFLPPDLTANQVKSIVETRFASKLYVVSADYKGRGVWQMKITGGAGWSYWSFDENTGELEFENPETVTPRQPRQLIPNPFRD